MKKLLCLLLAVCLLVGLTGCSRISIPSDSNGVLNASDFTQVLAEEESIKVKEYLTKARWTSGIPGCPFDESISIAFDDQVFAIAYDDCASIWQAGSEDYYLISEEGRSYIVSLFEKYVGYFPYP